MIREVVESKIRLGLPGLHEFPLSIPESPRTSKNTKSTLLFRSSQAIHGKITPSSRHDHRADRYGALLVHLQLCPGPCCGNSLLGAPQCNVLRHGSFQYSRLPYHIPSSAPIKKPQLGFLSASTLFWLLGLSCCPTMHEFAAQSRNQSL